jgi:hypothetical protein
LSEGSFSMCEGLFGPRNKIIVAKIASQFVGRSLTCFFSLFSRFHNLDTFI